MATQDTTTMSSKGQVVIPESIRQQLGLHAGTQFVVVGDRDVVVLRPIQMLSMDDFEHLIATARSAARRAGMKKTDVQAALQKVRNRKLRRTQR
ncbi:MAG TPA: AbrB/MazE/SpoVT family DNA-binding domain-containing protein [Thermoguttaceae bacterium]